ncbi:preprotein translocase subunit SecG [Salinisphaera sp.]|uniref:preprotein translocase subunit SecG n=1 Tax=Salinisphaera sp. TaxID=1914330 RepID=UPI002D795612|nr:preprotein translocase subunit SecG [Salinisphaera sp.]HET7313635.1 preprotein translocase subunit SecG [Salinisphaera sp.]
MVYTILIIVQVVIALSLIALILLQHGKGADAGAAFGSGASGTVFGAKGSANFMSRATAGLATLFMLASLALAYLVNGASVGSAGGSVTDRLSQGVNGSATSVVQQQTEKMGGGNQAEEVQGDSGTNTGTNNSGSDNGNDDGGGNDNSAGNGNGLKIPD